MSRRPLFTVCIPAYNRAHYLPALLDSILDQEFGNYDILICEDSSPERAEIEQIVRSYQKSSKVNIHYEENPDNLGYDRNIRRLVELSKGEYCLFMGNDDLLCPKSLITIAESLSREPECGVVVRSYATFDESPDKINQVFRYFPQEYKISAGTEAVTTGYRRSVVISGMVIHRDSAQAVATSQFDGTLLYQLYLVGMILAHRSVIFVPDIIALRRDGTPPDFGNSEVEKGKFVPNDQTPESSVHFVEGMLKIASYVEESTGLKVFLPIRSDIGNYSYPILSIQANRSFGTFWKYGVDLGRLGLWRYPLFHLYFLSLILIGPQRSDTLIKFLKNRLGYTPRLGVAKKERV